MLVRAAAIPKSVLDSLDVRGSPGRRQRPMLSVGRGALIIADDFSACAEGTGCRGMHYGRTSNQNEIDRMDPTVAKRTDDAATLRAAPYMWANT